MKWVSALVTEWESFGTLGKIIWVSGLFSLITNVVDFFNWVKGNSMSNFSIISNIFLIVSLILFMLYNVTLIRQNKRLNDKILAEREKADRSVRAVYKDKNDEIEEIEKKLKDVAEKIQEELTQKLKFSQNEADEWKRVAFENRESFPTQESHEPQVNFVDAVDDGLYTMHGSYEDIGKIEGARKKIHKPS